MDDVKINEIDISNNDTASTSIEIDEDLNSKSENNAKRKKPVAAATSSLKLKRRKIKDPNAPKMPLTGYVRYMNSRRESLKNVFPEKTAIEHTKIIGLEWTQMPEEQKAPYLAEAEVDRQRYLKEIAEFMNSHPDILAEEILKNKLPQKKKKILTEKVHQNGSVDSSTIGNGECKPEKKESSKPNRNVDDETNNCAITAKPEINGRPPNENGVIQVFTDEFLEHNKKFDLELRSLRKSNSDIEIQNSVLEQHIENMKSGLEKMETANCELQEKNRLLEAYLDKLKLKLAHALSGLGIPTEPHGATLDNIRKYMIDLHRMATSNSHGHAPLNKAKDIIRKLDLHIQL